MGLCLSWRLAGKVVALARGQCYSHRCHRAEGVQTEVSDAGHGRGNASWADRVGVVPKRRGLRVSARREAGVRKYLGHHTCL